MFVGWLVHDITPFQDHNPATHWWNRAVNSRFKSKAPDFPFSNLKSGANLFSLFASSFEPAKSLASSWCRHLRERKGHTPDVFHRYVIIPLIRVGVNDFVFVSH